MEQTGLRSGVGLDFERVLIGPGDVEAAGHAHDGGRAVGFALFASRGVLGRDPRRCRCVRPSLLSGMLAKSPLMGVTMRQRQSSVTTETQ